MTLSKTSFPTPLAIYSLNQKSTLYPGLLAQLMRSGLERVQVCAKIKLCLNFAKIIFHDIWFAVHLRDHELVNQLNNNWTTTFPVLTMNPCLTSPVSDVISDGAKNFYFGNSSISNETMTELTNALSDRDIVHASARIGQWMATLGQDVFLYVMSKRPAKSYADPALIGYPPGDYG